VTQRRCGRRRRWSLRCTLGCLPGSDTPPLGEPCPEDRAGCHVGRPCFTRTAEDCLEGDRPACPATCKRSTKRGVCCQIKPGSWNQWIVRGRKRHWQDHGRRGVGERVKARSLPHRSVPGGEQVYRRNGEEFFGKCSMRLKLAARFFSLTKLMRCSGKRSEVKDSHDRLRQYRSELFAPADGRTPGSRNMKQI